MFGPDATFRPVVRPRLALGLFGGDCGAIPPGTPGGAVAALLASAQHDHEGCVSQLTAATAECERLATAFAAAVTLERQLRDKRQTALAHHGRKKVQSVLRSRVCPRVRGTYRVGVRLSAIYGCAGRLTCVGER
jgi:hypothetical protein